MNTNFQHTVLIIVAHTDDETLGLGGTIARHIENGDQVYAVSMTDGVGSRDEMPKNEIKIRAQAAYQASEILGFKWISAGNFPDNAMDSVPLLKITKFIEGVKSQTAPTIIYTHSAADLNIDHRIVSQAVLTAFRPQDHELWHEIRTFEVPSSTDYGNRSVTNLFYPNLFINITDLWDKKKSALNAYANEMRTEPHSRSIPGIENLAKYRGNQVGLNYAEAFEVIRKIER